MGEIPHNQIALGKDLHSPGIKSCSLNIHARVTE